jgi:protease-4
MIRAIAAAGVLLVLSGCTFLKVQLTEEVQPYREIELSGSGGDKVLLLDITGIIVDRDPRPSLSERKEAGLLESVREQLDLARSDDRVKAVVLRINSPGGSVTASDMLYHEIKRFKAETGVKVIAHFLDTGASGAYYVAAASDRITAQPTTVTGSIGVIMFRFDATGLLQKVGVQAVEISSGDRKGMGSPFKPLSPEDRKLFQGVIDSFYERFIALVSESRKLPLERVRKLADGRIYTSQDALAAGLIDGIGYLDDAVTAAKRQAGLTEARVVRYARPGDYRSNVYSMNLVNIDLGAVAGPGPQFFYLWNP